MRQWDRGIEIDLTTAVLEIHDDRVKLGTVDEIDQGVEQIRRAGRRRAGVDGPGIEPLKFGIDP
jgi:hypothetical protein